MTRDLPKNVPIAVMAAAELVLAESERLQGNRSVAASAYEEHLKLARAQTVDHDDELHVMASQIFDWGVRLRAQMPSERLCQSFCADSSIISSVARDRGHNLTVSVIKEQVAIKAEGTAPGGTMVTELQLYLSPSSRWLFRRFEQFDGHLVHGGDHLNTVTGIQTAFFPQVLRAIHTRIADGDVWQRIEHSLKNLIKNSTDR